jgi:hypothetical protein
MFVKLLSFLMAQGQGLWHPASWMTPSAWEKATLIKPHKVRGSHVFEKEKKP